MSPRIHLIEFPRRSELGDELLGILARFCRVTRTDGAALSGPSADALLVVTSTADEACDRIEELRHQSDQAPVIVVTSATNADALMRVLRAGASDFITPPLVEAEVLSRLGRLLDSAWRRDPVSASLKEKLGLQHFVGECPAILRAIRDIPVLARCDSTVLIRGETGTGKEICARAIHYLSPRAASPFVPVNCGAIPESLVENELFGHESGAFTGAQTTARGLVREAEGGTLFLDEIDCLPLAAQVKVLRLLQEHTFRSLGSTRTRTADIRVVSSCNADLLKLVSTNQFRADLYYRIDVLPLHLVPLRERGGDIVLLVRHFLGRFARQMGGQTPELSPAATCALLEYDWPGNVRELEHVIERALVFLDGATVIRRADIRLPGASDEFPTSFQKAKARAIAKFEISYLTSLLRAHGGNITQAAHAACKDPRALRLLIRKRAIDVDQFR